MSIELGAVADRLGVAVRADDRTVLVDDVHHDSRDVGPGSLFVAIRGDRADGHDFADRVVEAGAVAIVAERSLDVGVPVVVVGDSRRAMAIAARAVHGDPDERLSIVGVTGTNGKTTVVHICDAIWEAVGRRHGIIGTLGARFAGTPVPLQRTTPESSDLQRLLGVMADARVSSVAMEVSSHAIELRRADAIEFTAVGFTNLTQDHLDFHGTMDEYLASKQRLFDVGRSRRAVVNVSNPAGVAIAGHTRLPVTTVAVGRTADLRAEALVPSPSGTAFRVDHRGSRFDAEIPLLGAFNVENALVALGLAIADDVPVADAVAGLSHVPPIRGRMEMIPGGDHASVVIDYAHTPDAIAAVLRSISNLGFRRRIVVVGAGGDRDRGKRHEMGLRAGEASDVVFVTTDNPRFENPVDIARSVQEGALAPRRADVRVVLDRREAIGAAIEEAERGDIVLVLGKGHEQGQEIAGVVEPFDDRSVARSFMERPA